MRKRTSNRVGSKKTMLVSKKVWLYIGLFLIILLGIRWHYFFEKYSKLVPEFGGIYTEEIVGTFKNTNPLSEKSTNFDKLLQKLIYSGLVEFSLSTGQYEPALATFRISEDALTYSLTIRDSARFSDGDKVDADDVLFTFQDIIQHPNFTNKLLRDRFQYIEITKKSDRVVEFKLPEANAFFLKSLTTPILKKSKFDSASLEEVLDADFQGNRFPVGSGPFSLKNIVLNGDDNSRVFLNSNKYFYKSKPYIKNIVFSVSKIENFSEENLPTACINCDKQGDENFDEKSYQLPQYVGLFFNTEGLWAQHTALRRGLGLGINKEKLLKGNAGWDKISSPFFFYDVEDFVLSNTAAARSDLVNGGFKWDSKLETRRKGGVPVEVQFIVPTLPPVFSRFSQKIKQQWEEELGVAVNLQILPKEEFLVALGNRDYDVVLTGIDFSGVSNMSAIWHSDQSGKFNLSNLTNETADSLIREFQIFGSQSDLHLLHEKLTELAVSMPLFTPKYQWFVSKNLKGVIKNFKKLPHHSERFWGVENWYFDETKDWNIPTGKTKIGTFVQFLFGADS